mgnify:CR=1 FL=1
MLRRTSILNTHWAFSKTKNSKAPVLVVRKVSLMNGLLGSGMHYLSVFREKNVVNNFGYDKTDIFLEMFYLFIIGNTAGN